MCVVLRAQIPLWLKCLKIELLPKILETDGFKIESNFLEFMRVLQSARNYKIENENYNVSRVYYLLESLRLDKNSRKYRYNPNVSYPAKISVFKAELSFLECMRARYKARASIKLLKMKISMYVE